MLPAFLITIKCESSILFLLVTLIFCRRVGQEVLLIQCISHALLLAWASHFVSVDFRFFHAYVSRNLPLSRRIARIEASQSALKCALVLEQNFL